MQYGWCHHVASCFRGEHGTVWFGSCFNRLTGTAPGLPSLTLLAAPWPSLLCVCRPPTCPRRAPEKSLVQSLALAYWSFHYVKRLLETFFVHK